MRWVRERVPIANGNRVVVSLDHLPAGLPALAFELEEIGARLAHELVAQVCRSTWAQKTET